jgi:hypothetical protein
MKARVLAALLAAAIADAPAAADAGRSSFRTDTNVLSIAYRDPDSSGEARKRNVRVDQRDYTVLAGREGYAEAGMGWESTAETSFGQMPQRKSCQAGASATFTPRLAQGGRYRVSFWSGDASEDRAVRAVIAGEKTMQRPVVLAAGQGQWVDLGIYDFRQGTSGRLSIYGSSKGCVRASAAKFVRAPEPSIGN